MDYNFFYLAGIYGSGHMEPVLRQMPFHVDAVRCAHRCKISVYVKAADQRPQFIQLFYLRFLRPVASLDFLVQQ